MFSLYTTVQGDTWDGIAKKIYGVETRLDVLLAANPEYGSVVIFSAGVTLNVPEADPVEVSLPSPPWRAD